MPARSKVTRRKAAPRQAYSRDLLLSLYQKMVLLRRFESLAQVACRKGETPGFFHLYIGEEATAVGVCAHLRDSDWVTSTHRGHGHALAKGMDPKVLMAELFGKVEGCCGGRGGTMHLYDRSIGLFGTNGIVAAGISHATGAGISARIRGRDDIGVAFFGDGAINHGGFHESVNFAGIQRAPVVFVCENNLYATATPLAEATLNPEIASKAAAYGIPGVAVDGNDVIAVLDVARTAVERARAGDGPTLIEAKTYRTVGHHEGDPVTGTYRTQDEVDAWQKRDPITLFRGRLVGEFDIPAAELDAIDAAVETVANEALAFARAGAEPDPATVARHVYAEPINPPEALRPPAARDTRQQGWLDAVRDGIAEEMRRDPHILYFGEGTGERGGTFAHTKNLYDEFGPQRMVDTPISEQGFTGAALGASATGARTIADLMFADFLFEAAGQIVLQGAKLRYMSNGQMNAPIVVRVGMGSIRSAGPHHSGAYYPMWAHVPGLIVCVPSNPADAKGLMKTALRASDPVLMLEPKALFASKGEVPVGEDHYVPFGVARVARSGTDLTIVAAGQLVQQALQAADALAGEGVEAEVIDLRTIMPLDVATVAKSVARTHRLLVVDEAWAMCGVGAELAQAMNEIAYDDLDAPVARLHTDAMTHPLAPSLERAMLVNPERIVAAARGLLDGRAPVPSHWRYASAEAPAETPARPAAPSSATVAPPPAPVAAAAPAADGEPITMPFGDLTISEGKIARWVKADGDVVAVGDLVAEIETDKSVVEIEAPAAGRLRIEQPPGTVVSMGGRIGVVGAP